MGTKTLPLKTRGERKLPLLCSNNNKRQNNNKNRNNIARPHTGGRAGAGGGRQAGRPRKAPENEVRKLLSKEARCGLVMSSAGQ